MGKRYGLWKRLNSPLSGDKEEPKMSMQVPNLRDYADKQNAEANRALNLKIIEIAMRGQQHAKKKKKIKKKKKKTKNMSKEKEKLNGKVDDMKEEKAESEKASAIDDKPTSLIPVDSSDNSVFRTLLRGPRYFDPPDSNWGTCYNCGEEGHAAFSCTAPRRLKPCFVCGSLDHNAKNCVKGKDCYICKKGGHIAKDCLEKNRGENHLAKMCLKCGDAGHDMFSCRSSYSTDELKEIQCYVCQKFGHLCCVEYTDNGPAELSCYRCGQLGHTGLACIGFHTETPGAGALSSCYKCGEEGHFARECTSSTKVGKRKRERSTPKKNRNKENGYEVKSVPNDLGKASKKKKIHHDADFPSASKPKHRGGWGTKNPGDFQEHGGWYGSSSRWEHGGGWGTKNPGDFQEHGGWYGSSSRWEHGGGWGSEDPRDFQEYGGWYGSSSGSKHIGGWGTEHPGSFPEYGGWYDSSSRSKHIGGWGTEQGEHPGYFQEYGGWHGSSSRSIHRGGWMTDNPGVFHDSGYKANCWRSPATPNPRKTLNYNYASSPAIKPQHHSFSNSGSYGPSEYYQHRFSSPQFRYNSNDVIKRDYGWQQNNFAL